MKTSDALSTTLTDVRRRLLAVGVAIGSGWAVVCALLFVLLWMWLDLALELTPGLRVLADVGALVLALVIVLIAAGRNLRLGAPLALAQRLDHAGGTRGQILTGADLLGGSGFSVKGSGLCATAVSAVGECGGATLSPGLAALAVERASELAAQVSRSLAVPTRPLFWPTACIVFLAVCITTVAVSIPRLASTQWQRFTDPFGDHPPYSPIWFDVEPRNAQVVYGDGLDIRAVAHDGVVEKVDLVLLAADGSHEEVLPMFPEPSGSWRAAVANVTSPQKYLVRSGRARSNRFDIGIITVPRFESVAFTVAPPAYTRQSAYDGPLPQGGLSGLPRTQVQVRVKSNRPLAGGVVEGTGFSSGDSRIKVQVGFVTPGSAETRPAMTQPAALDLRPGADPHEVVGTFFITGKGQACIRLTDITGQPSRETFPFPITLLADERPFIRILEPEREALATPDANIPVALDAEDDYGIARVRLFRSLNDSRPLPMDVALPKPPVGRWNGSATLPLGECGVAPGDVIKLFARVEDNDPDGAKGSESGIVTIRIIAQDDYERLMRTKEGMEVLQAKYEMANRYLEALLERINQLQKDLEKEPPESPLSKEQEAQIDELAKEFAKAAREIAKAAEKKLPYDLDKQLSPELKKLAEQMKEGAEMAKQLSKQKGQSASTLEKALRKLAEKAGADRKQFKEAAVAPVERLAAIYPLMEDQAMYVVLTQRQRELAERAAALKGKDSADDPDTKVRMRDLENEQHEIREALSQLLDSIEKHAAELPEDEELQRLRDTAEDFASAVRDSGVTDVQTEGESALAEFKGTDAAQKAKEAAELMEKFIGKCKSTGGEGQSACKLKFGPSICQSMSNSLDQLLSEAGMPKIGRGDGTGAGDGYSMQRTSLQNVGLYGNLPTMRQAMESGHSGQDARLTRPGNRTGTRNEAAPLGGNPERTGQASGAGGVEVPVQYKQKVGRYFERIADEIGDDSAKKGKK